MADAVKKLFGGADTSAIQAAQKKQEARLAAEDRNLAAVEAGQRRARGGGGGLRAFIDDKLKTTFGG